MKKMARTLIIALLMLVMMPSSVFAAKYYYVTSECEYVKARCQGNTVYIEIDKERVKKEMPDFAYYALKTGGEYKIRGSKKYKTLTVGVMGQDTFPFIVLLRSDGVIEYVNVNRCLEKWKFGITGRVTKLKDVIGFENAECADDEGGYITILAIHKNGARTDLGYYIK